MRLPVGCLEDLGQRDVLFGEVEGPVVSGSMHERVIVDDLLQRFRRLGQALGLLQPPCHEHAPLDRHHVSRVRSISGCPRIDAAA